MSECHCGKKINFTSCCEPVIRGDARASTAEQLMRARYSAYAALAVDFLHDSLHPDSREDFDFDATKQWAETAEWRQLTILDTQAGQQDDMSGTVDFVAEYIDQAGVMQRHCERSRFKKQQGEWFFCDGQALAAQKVGRNDLCPCGSGKKHKKCCA